MKEKTMMVNEVQYREKLIEFVRCGKLPYKKLLDILYDKEFYNLIFMDETIVEEGLYARWRFLDRFGIEGDKADFGPPNIIEVIWAIAVKIAEYSPIYPCNNITPGAIELFWRLVGNLDLLRFKDCDNFYEYVEEIYAILDIWLEHTYEDNGVGSIFPTPELNKKFIRLGFDYINMKQLEMMKQMQIYISYIWPRAHYYGENLEKTGENLEK